MRVLHSAATSFPSSGIINQMAWEQAAADSLSLRWDVRIFCPEGKMLELADGRLTRVVAERDRRSFWQKVIEWWKLRKDYYKCLLGLENDYDVFLLRYSLHDPFQWRFIKKTKNPVYLIHHTLEVHELASLSGIRGRVRAFAESVIGRHTLSRVRGIIGVTKEIVDYELSRLPPCPLSCVVYPNGIIYSGDVIAYDRSDRPELIFVASKFCHWHGLDLLLCALEKSTDQLVLHLVGNLSKRDMDRAEKDARIKLHGHLSQEQIRNLSSRCSLGLSSLALERNNMKEACTLKVREYLMMGLPVYSAHADIFPLDFPYYKNGPVDIRSILDFAEANAKISREAVSSAARTYVDKEKLLSELAGFLRKDLDLN